MFNSEVAEFPFVEALPRKEKSRLAKCWELLKSLSEATEREGALVPVMLAAKCLDVSRTRVDEICEDGRLRRVVVDGHVFVTEASIYSFARSGRGTGRPRKSLTLRDCMSIARNPTDRKS